VQHLYGIHPSVSVAQFEHYKTGKLIIQDRASCFPATIMSQTFGVDDFIKMIDVAKDAPQGSEETVRLIDACSAPGNKTTHLAALSGSSSRKPKTTMHRIHAFERDERRSKILKKMVGIAGANNCVDVVVGDFTQAATPSQYPEVLGLIVDPSCSGSGIFGRGFIEQDEEEENDDTSNDDAGVNPSEQERLLKLAGFQYKIVKHALSFPKARVVVYSTCSIHAQENEHVVERLLDDAAVAAQGWRVADRATVLPEWPRRGFPTEFNQVNQASGGQVRDAATVAQIAEGCVRALPKEDGGIGFFAVCFVRSEEAAQRWQDSHAATTAVGADTAVTATKGKKKGTKKAPVEKINNDHEESDDEEWGGFDD
jgi:putative methyltransferase